MVSIDNVPQWLSGIGTILAVIVALFQKSIHNILNKPKINISCKNVKQCMVEQNILGPLVFDGEGVKLKFMLNLGIQIDHPHQVESDIAVKQQMAYRLGGAFGRCRIICGYQHQRLQHILVAFIALVWMALPDPLCMQC